ncbi:hypothetical protein OnM2_054077 [Erysiphe neolycopersici]|uniref:Uncharacterized protein n=1 Tax=Erysiphe neolycopersici TaxID=212602 RepID=A0A420HRU0_9PEZI|nr:hypothetical protein OnM2_054077 [Erysiphe neolycopersici]
MASQSLSPGGALLRRSKAFSIPKPLSRSADIKITNQSVSKTATSPYPSHLSITTPLSSLKEGDWGLKRPLPIRTTTKTSSPSVRIEAIDTVEKITSFRSSGDHAITLQKWQELDLPITHSKIYTFDVRPCRLSVFEDEVDNLDKSSDDSNLDDSRWKFKGPWLGGICDGEFSAYLKSQVQTRKREFQDYLRNECARAKTTEARSVHISENVDGEIPKFEASDITDEEFALFVKKLRSGRVQLYRTIRSFLDLPPAFFADVYDTNLKLSSIFDSKGNETQRLQNEQKPTCKAPPKIHPSAGLYYSRTNSHMFNHPEFGPQAKKPPVQARVILPKNANGIPSHTALVGIAGFVAGIPSHLDTIYSYSKGFKDNKRFSYDRFPGLQNIDQNAETGSKSWVQLQHAEMDSDGYIRVIWDLGDPEAVAIKTNTLHELQQNQVPKPENIYWKKTIPPKKANPLMSNAKHYGLGSMAASDENEPTRQETREDIASLISDNLKMNPW